MQASVLNRSSTGDNDILIGIITNSINGLSFLFSALAITFVTLILVLLLKDRAYASSSFYFIYKASSLRNKFTITNLNLKVGLAYDIIALVTTLLFRTIPSFGCFPLLYTISPLPAQIILFFNYFTRVGQGLTNLFVCLNRASAILLPLQHEKIWNSRILFLACFSAQLIGTVVIGSVAASFGVHWLRYPQGQLYAMPNHSPALYHFWRAIFIPIVVILLSITALYMGILCKFWRQRSVFDKVNKLTHNAAENRQAFALFLLALCNVVIEILYCLAYFFSFVCKVNYQRDYRIFFAGNIVISSCYSTAPSVMLIIFCGSVRRHFWRLMRCNRQEIPITPLIMLPISDSSNSQYNSSRMFTGSS